MAWQGLSFPLLSNADNYIVHGFTNNDYLSDLGEQARLCWECAALCLHAPANVPSMLQSASLVFKSNASSLDLAMVVTYNNTRDFMMQACLLQPLTALLSCRWLDSQAACRLTT